MTASIDDVILRCCRSCSNRTFYRTIFAQKGSRNFKSSVLTLIAQILVRRFSLDYDTIFRITILLSFINDT
jgi:hypothetical protein